MKIRLLLTQDEKYRYPGQFQGIEVELEEEQDAVLMSAVQRGKGDEFAALGLIHPAEVQLLELGLVTRKFWLSYPPEWDAQFPEAAK